MNLNKACAADQGHKSFKRFHRGFRPVVLSSDRFNGIVSRSQQKQRQEQNEALEEEQRYKQYLQDGNNALLKCFQNMAATWDIADTQAQALKDNAIAAVVKEQKAQKLLDEMRKKRIIRANRIFNKMKPGPRGLHQALLTSEMIYQRDYQQAIKNEIARDEQHQQRLDEQLCPPVLVPFGDVTEQEVQAQQTAKMKEAREYYLKDIEDRRLRKLYEREQELQESIVEREQYRCLQEMEEKAAKKRAEQSREFCRRAYREALEEKAAIAKSEKIYDQIDDRIICVDQTTKRNLDARYNKQIREKREKRVRALEKHAVELCRVQQAAKEKLQEREDKELEKSDFDVNLEDLSRRCHIEELGKQRRAYELEERRRNDEQRLAKAEIRRFEVATRLYNTDVNQRFAAAAKKREDAMTAELRQTLLGQRDTLMQQRQEEQMRITTCDEDPYLMDDVTYFENAVQLMKECQELGRPLYPIAKAVKVYRRDNQLDMVPEGQMVRRSKRRDKCWPGFFSKAELAYRKYEHVERCRHEKVNDRQKIFDNCIKITKMASEERPFKPCAKELPISCFQHRGMPALSSVDSVDLGGFVCYEEDLPQAACPSLQQAERPPCKILPNAPDKCSSIMDIMQPGEENPPSESRATSLAEENLTLKPDTSSNTTPAGKAKSAVIFSICNHDVKRTVGGKQPSKDSERKPISKSTVGKSLSMVKRSNIAGSTVIPNHKASSPDLTRYWTAKPQAQVKAKIASLNYPIVSSIDSHRKGKCAKSGARKHFL